MPPSRLRPSRDAVAALVVGLAHALAIAALAARLDQPLDPLATAPGGTVGALVGLVAALAVPTYLAARHRLVGPLVVAALAGGWAVARELTTPPPEFSSLGGHTVVSGTRYVAGYVDGWYVWLLAALLVGLAEHVARTDWDRLPAPAGGTRLDRWLAPAPTGGAPVAAAIAAIHAAVFLALAADWGYFVPGGFLPSPWYVGLGVLAWTVAGLAAVGAVAGLLLARWRLVAPTLALAWLVWTTGWAQQRPLPDDPLPVYFLGWFFFAGVLLAVGSTEHGLRWAWSRARGRPSAG